MPMAAHIRWSWGNSTIPGAHTTCSTVRSGAEVGRAATGGRQRAGDRLRLVAVGLEQVDDGAEDGVDRLDPRHDGGEDEGDDPVLDRPQLGGEGGGVARREAPGPQAAVDAV